jgi:hypothetical protein
MLTTRTPLRTPPRAIANHRPGEAPFLPREPTTLDPRHTVGTSSHRRCTAPHASRTIARHAYAKPCLAATTYNARSAPHVPRSVSERTHGRSPGWRRDSRQLWRRRPTHSRTARNHPRTVTNARQGEALLAARTYTLTHCSTPSDGDPEPTHGRSPVWTRGPTR